MNDYIMNRESLKRHCEAMCERSQGVPTSGVYSEHRFVLDLLEQTRWIPVSEKLPEKDGDYLLFGKVVEDDTENIFIGMYDACAEKFGYWEDYYDRNTLGFLDSELIEYNKVIAWMPLPEPYKAESDPWEKWLYPNRKEDKE